MESVFSEQKYPILELARCKNFWSRDASHHFVMALQNDPGETRNVAEANSAILTPHRSRANELARERATDPRSLFQDLSEENRARLGVLGYLEENTLTPQSRRIRSVSTSHGGVSRTGRGIPITLGPGGSPLVPGLSRKPPRRRCKWALCPVPIGRPATSCSSPTSARRRSPAWARRDLSSATRGDCEF